MPVKYNPALKKQPFHTPTGVTYRLYHYFDLVLLVTGQVSVNACSGREKGACDRAPEASADLSDFQTSPAPTVPCGTPPPFSQKMGEAGKGVVFSALLAQGNLHLVILC